MTTTLNSATEHDLVRRHTLEEMLRQIEEQTEHNIEFYSAQPPEVIEKRIDELGREWSIERYLQVNVSTVGLTTAVLALISSRKWAVLSVAALGFFMFHALRGFDPPLPVLRRVGVRTRREIDREKYALKALRGDFSKVVVEHPQPRFPARQVLDAVNA